MAGKLVSQPEAQLPSVQAVHSRGKDRYEQDWLLQAIRPEWKPYYEPVDWKKWKAK